MGQQFLNLDFEVEDNDTRLPKNWYIVEEENCNFYSDHRITYNKKTSLLISPKKDYNKCKTVLLNELDHRLFKGKKRIKVIAYVRFKRLLNSQIVIISKQLSSEGKSIENIPHSEFFKSAKNKWYKMTFVQDIDPGAEYMAFGVQASLSDSAWIDNFEIYFGTDKVIETKPTIIKGPAKAEINWLNNNVIPIKITDSINAKDLKLFHKYINDFKIIALGEVTHGSSEIYQFKKRLIQFLFDNCDFKILAMEMDMSEARLINRYLLTSEGDIEKLISQSSYWPWKTNEFLLLLQSIATYNKTHMSKIQIMGFDIPFSTTGLEEINLFAAKYDTNILAYTTLLKLDYERLIPNIHDEKELTELKIKIDNLLSYYQNEKSKLVKRSSAKEYGSIERIIINIKQTLLYQLNVSDRDTYRDKCMAENVNWIINTNPSVKIVLWAHNSHLKRSGNSMGEILTKTHSFYSVGFALGNGYFNAIQESHGGEIDKSLLLSPITDSYESYFIKTNVPDWFINLRGLTISKNQNQWLLKSHQFRFVGTLLSRYQFAQTNLKKDYDGLFFIMESSPSHLLFRK